MRIFILLLFPVMVMSAEIGDRFVTSKGAEFKYVNHPEFGQAWEAPDHSLWGKQIAWVNHVDAIQACKDANGVLPALTDYQKLRSYFEMKPDSKILSERGLKDLITLFPDLKGNSFWTSTVLPEDSSLAYILDGVFGTLGSAVSERYLEVSVQCFKPVP